jgi:hypothetical protein
MAWKKNAIHLLGKPQRAASQESRVADIDPAEARLGLVD